MSDTQFTKVGPRKYAVEITLKSGDTRRILVKAEEIMNGSARGGAYRTRWVAYNGGMYLKVFGETRQEAFDKAFALLTSQGRLA